MQKLEYDAENETLVLKEVEDSISGQKLWARHIMFFVSVAILVAVTVVVIAAVIWACWYIGRSNGDVVAVLPTVIASVVSLLSAFMVIPKIIADYLYNSEEEKYLSEIIGKIQEYDSHIREKK